MPSVTGPDGRKLSFPDGTDQQAVMQVLREQYPDAKWDQPAESKQQKYERLLAENEARQPSDPMHPSNNPTTGMSGFGKFAAGVGKSIYDTGRGVKQLFGGMSREEVDAQRQQDAALMETGAGLAGNIAGTVGQVLLPGGVLKAASRVPDLARGAQVMNAASRAFLPNTIKGAVAQGGAIGATQQVGTGDSRMSNTGLGALLSGVGVAVPRAAGAVYRSARNGIVAPTVNGAQRAAARTIQELADDPAALMQARPSAIPGVRRTLFEESLVPSVARLETRSRGTANGWKEFDAANDGARQAAIRTFAGDEAALDGARAARSKAADPLYAAANKAEGVDTSRLVSQIKRLEKAQEGRTAVQKGLADVRNLLVREVPEAERKKTALAALDAFASGGRKSAADFDAAKAAMSAVRRGEVPQAQFVSQAGRDALKAAQKAMKTESAPQDKMRVIANVRLTINDMLAGKYGGESGQAMAGSRALMAVKNQLDRVAAKGSPEFAQATQAFRSMSAPVNRMQAGQRLLEQATSRNLDPISGQYPLVSGMYGGKVKGLDKLVQDATGFRKAKAANVFRPEDMRTIGNVQDDLSRSAARLQYGNGGGSHTASQGELGLTLARKAFARVIPGFNNSVEYLDAAARTRVDAALNEMLMNPAEFRRVAAALPPNERALVELAFTRLGQVSGANAVPLLSE